MTDLAPLVLLALGWLLGIATAKALPMLRHRHEWSEWTRWMGIAEHDEAHWERLRRCYVCGAEQKQRGGYHVCEGTKVRRCPHADDYEPLLDRDVGIRKIERDLGLGD